MPACAPCSWSAEPLSLRYEIPKIWSQPESRGFGIYWSDVLSYGRLWPEPTDAELDLFHNIPGQFEYSGGGRVGSGDRGSIVSRMLVKIAWLSDRGIVDPSETILSLTGPAPTVCDIGCGVGTFLEEMMNHGATVTGVDPSTISGESARDKGIEFYPGLAEALPSQFDGRQFDVVTMLHCLTCCRDPELAVRNAVSLLKRDGLLVIEVSNMDCLGFETYGPAWWHTDAGRNLHFFTKQSLTRLVFLAGASPIRWEYRGFVTQFTPGWVNTMKKVREGLGSPADVPKPSLLKSASYMPRALISGRSRKYESIRVYAKLG